MWAHKWAGCCPAEVRYTEKLEMVRDGARGLARLSSSWQVGDKQLPGRVQKEGGIEGKPGPGKARAGVRLSH